MIAGPITPERLAGLPDSAPVPVRVHIYEKRRRLDRIELRAGLLRRLLGYAVDLTQPLVFKAGKLHAYRRTNPMRDRQRKRLSAPLTDLIVNHAPDAGLVRTAPRGLDGLNALLRIQGSPDERAHPRIKGRDIANALVARINATPREQRRLGPLLSSFINSTTETTQ